MIVERLAWDSEFFGIEIGRAITKADLAAVGVEAQKQGLACIYIESFVELGDPPPLADLVLTDTRVRLRCTRPALPSVGRTEIEVRVGEGEDVSSVASAIEALVPWSRFAKDPRFGPHAARRMYWRWVERAAASDDEMFAVAVIDSAPIGFITVTRGDRPEIGLIGTHPNGTGAGTSLVRWALSHVDHASLEVVTQASNERALALYRREGFEDVECTYAYHLWVKETDG